MGIFLNIPPETERLLRRALGDDLDRAAIDALLIEGYRTGRLSSAEIGGILGLSDRNKVELWLAERDVPLNYSLADLEADRAALREVLRKTG